MSDYIRIFCRSLRLIALPGIIEFIEDGVYFEEARFEPLPSDAESDWQTLMIFYQPEKRPLVLQRNVNDALMRNEIARISADWPENARRFEETFQTIAIEISSTFTDEAWEMLDSLEAYLARTYDGIVYVDGEGFYDAALQKMEERYRKREDKMMEDIAQEMSPRNALEEAMAEAKAGTLAQEEFLRRLLETPILIPSRQETQADGAGLVPLVLDRAGAPFVAVFTSPERLQSLGGQVPYCIEMKTSAFLPRLPASYGLIVNPGYALSLEIAAYGIENIIKLLIAPA